MRLRELRTAVGTVGVLAAMVLFSACSSTPETTPTSQAPAPSTSSVPSVSATASVDPATYTSTIAHVKGKSIEVSDTPGGPTTMTLKSEDVLTVPESTPLVLLAKTVQPDAIEVYLPVRPNGTTGWVDPADVDLFSTDFALDVYHDSHTMTLSEAGVVVATYSIATGKDDMPTPGGTYFLRELLAPPDPTGPYGPYAYGLSGYSPVLDSFNGGDAVIGIHGTNVPSSIGTDVSHGCIRMHNADITELVEKWALPLGVPVYIHN